MDGLNAAFLLVYFTSAAFAYNCVQKACYSEDQSQQQCSAETICTANDLNGCMIERYSGDFISTFHNCSSLPCIPTLYKYNGTEVTVDCCFTDECNNDSMAPNTVADPAVDECYSVSCTIDNTESCLIDAVVEGKARLCHLPPNGDCLTSIKDGGYHTTCSAPDYCVAFEWGSIKFDCCTGDLCNFPTAPPTTDDQGLIKCYSVKCNTEGCLGHAIRGGYARTCPRSPNGYCMSKITKQSSRSNGTSTLEVAGCREKTAYTCSNIAEYDSVTGRTSVSQCCHTERCNDGIVKTFPDVPNCLSVVCNGTRCIKEAILKGIFAYCPQTGYGCNRVPVVTRENEFFSTCGNFYCFDCCYGHLCNAPSGYKHPIDSTLSNVTTTYRTRRKETVKSSAEEMHKSSTEIYEPDVTTKRYSSKSSNKTSEHEATKTKDTSKSSTETMEPEATTTKNPSGAGSLGHTRYFNICSLAILILTIFS